MSVDKPDLNLSPKQQKSELLVPRYEQKHAKNSDSMDCYLHQNLQKSLVNLQLEKTSES